MTSSDTPDKSATKRSRGVTIALWVGQVLLAINFAGAAYTKLTADPAQVELFTTLGFGMWLMYFVGTCELAGTIGVLIPRLSGLAAIGLVALMIGATTVNLFVVPGAAPMAALTAVLAIVAGLVAWARWPETKSLPALLKH